MRERSYKQRNKKIKLKEVPNLYALHGERTEGSSARSNITEDVAGNLPPSDLRAFENAGWVFHEGESQAIPQDAQYARVFLTKNGGLALGTNMLTVQFHGDPSEEDANALLEPYGSHVVQRLTFAPGLYQVAVDDPGQGDSLDVGNKLLSSGSVKFAEPVLIESMGHR